MMLRRISGIKKDEVEGERREKNIKGNFTRCTHQISFG
jgi:hypothetical protein